MSLTEEVYSLHELKRSFVRLKQPSANASFHLVIESHVDGSLRTACGRLLASGQLAQQLTSASDPLPFCFFCQRGQAHQI